MSRSVLVAALMALGLFAPSLAQASDELSTSNRLDDRRFVTIGPRAYELGTEAGRYPAAGFHTRGEMGGVWTPPIKLVDGIWFGVGDDWIGPATPLHERLRPREDAAPAQRRAERRAHRLRARRAPRRARRPAPRRATASSTVKLRMQTHSELMSIYPWGETKPYDQTDLQPARHGRRSPAARSSSPSPVSRSPEAPAHTWGAAVGSALTPTGAPHRRRLPRPAGPDVDLPGLRPGTPPQQPDEPLRRHRVRQGQGRRADLQDQAPALRPHDRVVRRRRLRVGRHRRPRRARASCSTTRRARCARSSASARRSHAHTQLDLPGDRLLAARHRLEQAEPRRLRAGDARPRAARGQRGHERTRPPRRTHGQARASSAPASPTTRGCSRPTASSRPSPPSRSASSSRSRSTCGRSRRRRSSSTTAPARSSTRWSPTARSTSAPTPTPATPTRPPSSRARSR